MFVINKRQTSKRQKGKNVMAKETKPVNTTNKVGQMYEERKSGRIGVIEEVNEKYKTYMMRDKEGKSFNITFATLKSNWRKYQGEEVIQTSTQVEEQKVEEEQKIEQAEEAIEEVVKETKKRASKRPTDERVKIVRALRTLLENGVKDAKYALEVKPLASGGTIVKLKGRKRTHFDSMLTAMLGAVEKFVEATGMLDDEKEKNEENVEEEQ